MAGIVIAALFTATPAAADTTGFRDFPNPPPDPARCTMAPVDVVALIAAATPVPVPLQVAEPMLVARGIASAFANPDAPFAGGPFALLPPAASNDQTAIESLETQFDACRNTGDDRRWFAFYTLAWQRGFIAGLGDRAADFFTPPPDPFTRDDWVPVKVGPVVDLGDGRLAALVDFCEDRWIRVYVQEGGTWRIAGQAPAPERPGEPTRCTYPLPDPPPPPPLPPPV